MMLNDWHQSREEYETRLAEAAEERRANALLKHSQPKSRRLTQRILFMLRSL